jgi:hypothetical protein
MQFACSGRISRHLFHTSSSVFYGRLQNLEDIANRDRDNASAQAMFLKVKSHLQPILIYRLWWTNTPSMLLGDMKVVGLQRMRRVTGYTIKPLNDCQREVVGVPLLHIPIVLMECPRGPFFQLNQV